MKHLRKVAVVVALVTGAATIALPAQAAPDVGVGAIATISRITYPPHVHYGDPITIGDVRLQGGVLFDVNGYGRFVDDVHIGAFHGLAWDLCTMTRNCGYTGITVDFDNASVPLYGKAVGGEVIYGSCHGGGMQFGAFGTGPTLHTTCTATVAGKVFGPFALGIAAFVKLGTSFIGPWCVPDVCAALALVIPNPQLFGP